MHSQSRNGLADQVAAELRDIPTAAVAGTHAEIRVLSPEIAAMVPGSRMVGVALTVRTPAGQNAEIHRAIASAHSGDVIVVDAAMHTSTAHAGGVLALACRYRGVTGLVIDGAVRDLADLRAMKFPVFARGVTPRGPAKTYPGEIKGEITCGGVLVRTGDIVIGDDDGVVVIPFGVLGDAVARAKAQLERDQEAAAQLKNGRTTCELFGILP